MKISDMYLFPICLKYWLHKSLHNVKICKSHFFLGHPVYFQVDFSQRLQSQTEEHVEAMKAVRQQEKEIAQVSYIIMQA